MIQGEGIRLRRPLVCCVALLSVVLPAGATVSFDLQLANPGTSIVRLKNTSDEPGANLTGLAMTIGDPQWNFDFAGNAQAMIDTGAPLTWALLTGDTDQGGDRTDLIEWGFDGFEPGDRFSFNADLDLDTGDSPADFREVHFNNGTAPNSVVTVRFADGPVTGGLRMTLPDQDLSGDPQVLNFAGQLNRAPRVGFELEIANPGVGIMRLRNTADEAAEITGLSATVGDTTWNYDLVTNVGPLVDAGAPLVWTLVAGDTEQGGVRTDEIAFDFTGFEVGDRFAFTGDLDPDSYDGAADFRTVLMNNGDADNALITVDFLVGDMVGALTLSLPDADLVDDPQVLQWPVQGRLLPEPSTALLLLAALPLVRRRRRRG